MVVALSGRELKWGGGAPGVAGNALTRFRN